MDGTNVVRLERKVNFARNVTIRWFSCAAGKVTGRTVPGLVPAEMRYRGAEALI